VPDGIWKRNLAAIMTNVCQSNGEIVGIMEDTDVFLRKNHKKS